MKELIFFSQPCLKRGSDFLSQSQRKTTGHPWTTVSPVVGEGHRQKVTGWPRMLSILDTDSNILQCTAVPQESLRSFPSSSKCSDGQNGIKCQSFSSLGRTGTKRKRLYNSKICCQSDECLILETCVYGSVSKQSHNQMISV